MARRSLKMMLKLMVYIYVLGYQIHGRIALQDIKKDHNLVLDDAILFAQPRCTTALLRERDGLSAKKKKTTKRALTLERH